MPTQMYSLLALTATLLVVSITGSDASAASFPAIGAQQLYKYFDRDMDKTLSKRELELIGSEMHVGTGPESWSCLASHWLGEKDTMDLSTFDDDVYPLVLHWCGFNCPHCDKKVINPKCDGSFDEHSDLIENWLKKLDSVLDSC